MSVCATLQALSIIQAYAGSIYRHPHGSRGVVVQLASAIAGGSKRGTSRRFVLLKPSAYGPRLPSPLWPEASSFARALSLEIADCPTDQQTLSRRLRTAKTVGRQALPDQWSNLSGDVFNISVWINGAMSLQNNFVAARAIGCSGSRASSGLRWHQDRCTLES